MENLEMFTLLEIRQELMDTRNFIEYILNLDRHIVKIDQIIAELNNTLNKEDML